MQNNELLGDLFDKKILAILTTIINDTSEEGLYLREISKSAKVPAATTYRMLQKLKTLQVIKEIKIKKSKFYKPIRSRRTEFLFKLLKKDIQVLNIFIEQIKELPEIQLAILHGEQAHNRANLLLIGQNIDTGKVKEICGTILDKYNFTISPLSLTPEQYEQMSNMGLYSGNEKVIWKR